MRTKHLSGRLKESDLEEYLSLCQINIKINLKEASKVFTWFMWFSTSSIGVPNKHDTHIRVPWKEGKYDYSSRHENSPVKVTAYERSVAMSTAVIRAIIQ
jgi:hypothetical protein